MCLHLLDQTGRDILLPAKQVHQVASFSFAASLGKLVSLAGSGCRPHNEAFLRWDEAFGVGLPGGDQCFGTVEGWYWRRQSGQKEVPVTLGVAGGPEPVGGTDDGFALLLAAYEMLVGGGQRAGDKVGQVKGVVRGVQEL